MLSDSQTVVRHLLAVCTESIQFLKLRNSSGSGSGLVSQTGAIFGVDDKVSKQNLNLFNPSKITF